MQQVVVGGLCIFHVVGAGIVVVFEVGRVDAEHHGHILQQAFHHLLGNGAAATQQAYGVVYPYAVEAFGKLTEGGGIFLGSQFFEVRWGMDELRSEIQIRNYELAIRNFL